MADICDRTSVGIIVWKGESLLLIERAKFPFAFTFLAEKPTLGNVLGGILVTTGVLTTVFVK